MFLQPGSAGHGCVFFAQEVAYTGITPTQFQPGEDRVPSLSVQDFQTLPLSNGLPIGFLHDTWTWLDLFHGGQAKYASHLLHLPSLPQGSRSHYEKLLHELHWTIGHNQCEGARTNAKTRKLLTCALCRSADKVSPDTYNHVFRLCPHPPLLPGRQASNDSLAMYSLDSDLEEHLIPKVLQLVRSADCLRICLGN